MSHDNEFCKEQIVKHLLGGTITGVLDSDVDDVDDFGVQFFGLRIMKDGKQFAAWVQMDAEGNGPGWVEVEEIPD